VSKPIVAVNGRFLTMETSGVQRYAREILGRLVGRLEADLRVIVPPDRVFEGEDPALADSATSSAWHGAGGHRWEQIVLPRLARRSNADLLWSPCNWGPLAVHRQVPVVHDIAPLKTPEYFTPAYRALARVLTGTIVRRALLVVTPSRSVRVDLRQRFALGEEEVEVVPPGIGPPFDSAPLDDLDSRPGTYCLLVGAHDARKNVEFVLDLWPEVRARTGLELHVTRQRLVTTRRQLAVTSSARSGVVVHFDPTDAELATLYANALCLLLPSKYEGYGLPLLEAMAVGTPFLATDVGAAGELAPDPERQVLPLDPELWRRQLEEWHEAGLGGLRDASARRARSQTWEAAAAQTAVYLDRLARP
jgi:glycosyltransferase involved in cell wall biosynthesis